MDREELLKKMKSADSEVDKETYDAVLEKSIFLGDNFHHFEHGSINLIIAIEELSELQKELCKWLRNEGDPIAITEEIADVQVELEYIKKIVGVSNTNINKVTNVKMERQIQRDKKIMEENLKNGIRKNL